MTNRSLKELKADPTFDAKASIPRPGKSPVEVSFTYQYRDRKAALEWIKKLNGRDLIEAVMDCAVAWELTDPFTAEAVKELNDEYMRAADAIIDTYLDELTKAKSGN